MRHYFANVPRLGNVAISRHAQDRCREDGITEAEVTAALYDGELTPDGPAATWAERNGVRLVILNHPEPFRGAKLVITIYRVEGQAVAQ